jgi:polynucleotide 5'-hydroxyl-kinase GRC3/NOL9
MIPLANRIDVGGTGYEDAAEDIVVRAKMKVKVKVTLKKRKLQIWTLQVSPKMLSAVAARKAALAAHQDLAKPLVRPGVVSPPPTPSPVSTPPPQLVSKRKPTAQAPNPSRKAKKKKIKHEKPRYFAAEDSFVKQDDIIAIDEDNSDDSEDEGDVIELDDPLPDTSSKSTIFEKPASSKGKRTWSPSRPLQDSSDEETDDGEDEANISDTPIAIRPPRAVVVEERPLLSTFELNWNNNAFVLSSAETELLESSTLVGNSTIAIVMTPGETLCLLGTYALIVLHGSVYLAGVTLTPSRTTHHVFASRCSAVPALRCLQTNGKTRDPVTTSLPERLHPFLQADCAIVVLRELRTGVDGLGRVCRTFDGVFEPSRWHRNDIVPDLGLTGIRMVKSSIVPMRTTF